jgi:FkbM family methyltransferase
MGRLAKPLFVILPHTLRVLATLSVVPGAREKLRFVLVWLALELRRSFGLFARKTFTVEWQGPAGPLRAVVADVTELWAIWETFVEHEYELADGLEPTTILDLGSNVGISVLYFSSLYPTARIIAVEADPNTFNLLRQNTAHLDAVTPVHAAVAKHSGEVTLYSGAGSLASSLLPADDRNQAHVVPAQTLDGLTAELGIERVDLIKMDIEGAEVDVIGSSRVLETAEVVLFEFHQEHSDESLWTVLGRLPAYRMRRFRGDSQGRPVVELVRT